MNTARRPYRAIAIVMAAAVFLVLAAASVGAGEAVDCRVPGAAGDRGCATNDHASPERPVLYRAFGVLKRIDERGGTVTVAHEAVQELKWPAMTMVFRVSDRAILRNLVIDRRYELTIVQDGNQYLITGLR